MAEELRGLRLQSGLKGGRETSRSETEIAIWPQRVIGGGRKPSLRGLGLQSGLKWSVVIGGVGNK